MDTEYGSPTLLTGFLLLSLLLHLILLLLLPRHGLFSVNLPVEPVVVEMRPAEVRPRELDLPAPERETPRDTPAKRLGPADQVVKRETAPEGTMPEDRTPTARTPAVQPTVRQPPPAPAPSAEERPRPESETATAPKTTAKREKSMPTLKTLMASAEQAAKSVAEAQIEDWRRKYRENVEKGDAVWLDTEKDILFSFFKRFRDQIYGVWNYPPNAAERGQEGTCLLKVTINRDGTVRDVKVMESSGVDILDEEATVAVLKAAPYGSLPASYTEPELNVFAFFQYNLIRKVRPGDIW